MSVLGIWNHNVGNSESPTEPACLGHVDGDELGDDALVH